MRRVLAFLMMVLVLSGCATAVRYVNYTDQKFTPKSKYYFITVYESQPSQAVQPFRVIGRVDISGYISDGVTPDTLTDQAKVIARHKGADAIINAKIASVNFDRVDMVAPGYVGYHHYRPPVYYYSRNALLSFRGELIVFTPAPPKEDH